MVIWLTGNSGSGKTALANAFRAKWPQWILLDGDVMRASISLGAGFTKEDREEHNLRVARLADVLDKQGHNIIIAVIAPYKSTRKKIEDIVNCEWVYMKRTMVHRENYPYEVPSDSEALTIDVDNMSIDEEVLRLERMLK